MFWKKKKPAGGDKTVIFFASDLHGSDVCFKKFVNGAKFYGANVLVMGGDLTGKAVIPITEQADGTFTGFRLGEMVTLNDRDEVDEFVKRVNNQVVRQFEFFAYMTRAAPASEHAHRSTIRPIPCRVAYP